MIDIKYMETFLREKISNNRVKIIVLAIGTYG